MSTNAQERHLLIWEHDANGYANGSPECPYSQGTLVGIGMYWYLDGVQSFSPISLIGNTGTLSGVEYISPENGSCVTTASISASCDISKLPYGEFKEVVFTKQQITSNTFSTGLTFSRTQAAGFIRIGISPPSPTGIKLTKNGATASSAVEGENIQLALEGTTYSSEYEIYFEYSKDNTNWSPANPTNFIVPAIGELTNSFLGDVDSKSLYFRARVKRNISGVPENVVSYSPYFYQTAYQVRRTPPVTYSYSPSTVQCTNGKSTFTFTMGDIPSGRYVSLWYRPSGSSSDVRIGGAGKFFNKSEVANQELGVGTYSIIMKYHYGPPYYNDYSMSQDDNVTVSLSNSPSYPPNITTEPTSSSVCNGDNTSFSVGATGTSLSYQWQLYSSGAWVNLSNDGVYNGVTAPTLTITGVTAAMNSNQYQCYISNSCGYRYSGVTAITVKPLPTASITVSETSGVANNDGITCSGAEVTLIASGGSSYSWIGIGTDNAIKPKPLVSTTYSVIVTGSNGCKSTTSKTITVNQFPSLNVTPSSTCGPGTVTLSASTTPNTSTINWYNAFTGGPSLATGSTYSPTISTSTDYFVDATLNSCTTSPRTKVTAVVNTVPAVTLGSNPSVCYGTTSAGIAYSQLTGGANQYSINFNDAANAAGFMDVSNTNLPTNIPIVLPSNAASGTYNATLKVRNKDTNCESVEYPISVTVKPLPNSAFTLGDPVICNEQTATIIQSGSESGVNYQLQLTSNSDNVGAAVSGTGNTISYSVNPNVSTNYKVIATRNGCSVVLTDQAVVTVKPLPIPTITGPIIVCAKNQGNVYLTQSGMSDYTWFVSGGEFDSNVPPTGNSANITWNTGGTGGGKGYVSVKYRHTNGCLAQIAGELEPTIKSLYFTTPALTDVKCHGNNTGKIDITALGGTSPYTYVLKRGNSIVATNNDGGFSGLIAASDYTVVVSDNTCSITSDPITINEPSALNIEPISITPVDCYGNNTGAIELNVTGGTPPLSYLWTGPNGFSNTNKNISGLKAGAYKLIVKDGNECTKTSDIVITQPSAPLLLNTPVIVHNICNGGLAGKITIVAAGGTPKNIGGNLTYNYTLTGGGVTPKTTTDGVFEGLPSASDYSVTVTDENLCTATISNITINQPAEVYKLSILSSQNVTCPDGNNGYVELKVEGGTSPFTFTKDGAGWTTPLAARNYTFDNLISKGYTFTVKDDKQCESSISKAITQPNTTRPTADITNVKCKGGSNGKLSFNVIWGTSPYTLELTGPNAYSRTINNVSQKVDFDGLKAGVYDLMVTDNVSCNRKFLTYEVLEPATPLVLSTIFTQNPTCYHYTDGKIDVNATGGWGNYSYSLLSNINTNGNFVGLGKNTYNLQVTDAGGCVSSVSASLDEPNHLELSSIIKHLDCMGDGTGQIKVNVAGGTSPYKYSFGRGFNALSDTLNLQKGTYSLSVLDSHGCLATGKADVTEPEKLKMKLSNTRDDGFSVNCTEGKDSVWVTPLGGTAPYTLNLLGQSRGCLPSGYTLRNLANNRYPLLLTDSHNCVAKDTAVISNLPGPKIKLISVVDARCSYSADGSIEVKPSSPTNVVSVSWDNRTRFGNLISNLPGGVYTAKATDLYGCTHDTTITVGKPDSITISLSKKRDPHCYAYSDGVLKVVVNRGETPYQYLWSNGSQVDSTGGVPSGLFRLKVTDSKGCIANASYRLVDPPTVKPNLLSTKTICSNQTFDVDAGMPNATSYFWFSENGFTSNSRKTTLSVAGNYYLLVTDANGCTGKDTLTLVKDGGTIDANFIMAERACVGDTIVAIEMSWPIPEAIDWIYPAAFREIFKTDYSIYLVPQMIGTFNIGLNSYLGVCSQYTDKPIIIEAANPDRKKRTTKQALIKDVAVFPNPSRGDFSVAIDLSRESNATVEVYTVYGNVLFRKQVSGLVVYKVDVNLFQSPGIYLVRITAGDEYRSVRVVVN